MKYEFKFQKILNLKEREKEEAFTIYEDSVRKFEEAAERLYELLKKKETLEENQSEQLLQGLAISEMRQTQQFIDNMERAINHCQLVVQNARNKMDWCKEKLKESNIEVKKYEKMKEKNYQSYLIWMNEKENIQLDEISTIQYFHRAGGI